MDLGFYYMANAMGRLAGVLIGGFLYHYTVSQSRYACPTARPLLTVICPHEQPTQVDRAIFVGNHRTDAISQSVECDIFSRVACNTDFVHVLSATPKELPHLEH